MARYYADYLLTYIYGDVYRLLPSLAINGG